MPELAEVALFARGLNQAIGKRQLSKVSFPIQDGWEKIIAPALIRKRIRDLQDSHISFCSAGKALILKKSLGRKNSVVEFRLGMTGTFQLGPISEKWRKHCFLSFSFEDVTINYIDPRRFGRIMLPNPSQYAVGGFCDQKGFWKSSALIPLKGYLSKPRLAWLLETGHETGVGNYMANEALGRLNMSPFEPCVDVREAIRLLKKTSDVAAMSFKKGGNSFGSGFYDVAGREGEFAPFCKFYQNPNVPRLHFRGRPVFTYFDMP